jgi:hypothetical protein
VPASEPIHYLRSEFTYRQPALQCAQRSKDAEHSGVTSPLSYAIYISSRICHAVHGFDRGDELRDASAASTATVVEHLGRITGYATGIAFFAHAVGETNQDLKALIGAARVFAGPGFLVPTQNYDLFAWCLTNGALSCR